MVPTGEALRTFPGIESVLKNWLLSHPLQLPGAANLVFFL